MKFAILWSEIAVLSIFSIGTSDTSHYQKFEIPASWEWSTLGEIFSMQAGKNIRASELKEYSIESPYPCFGGNGIRGYVSEFSHEGTHPIIGRQGALCGNIRMANENFYATEHAVVVDYFANTDVFLWGLFLEALNLNQYATATAQPGLSVAKIEEVPIPVPPLDEQRRIVRSFNIWMEHLYNLEESSIYLLDTVSIAKAKILELAVQGKLVSQDLSDEPAADMLRRVNPNAKIITDNPHCRLLPCTWCLASLGELCTNINGLWKGKKKPFVQAGVIRNANFTKDFKLDYSKIEYIEVEEKSFAQRHLIDGDLIVEKSGGSDNNPVGRAILYEGEDGLYSFSNFTMVLRPRFKEILSSKYLYYVILSRYRRGDMRRMQTQTTGLHNLILDKYLEMEVALPSVNEQRRIVAKIEELFSVLDSIEASLQS